MPSNVEAEIFVNTTTKRAQASATGLAIPSVTPSLQTHLLLTVYFFANGEDPALLAGSPSFRVALKDKDEPSGAVLCLLSSPTDTGADYYEFEWNSVDSAALRTLLGDLESVEAVLEIEWTISGAIERVRVPVTIDNTWIRTADAAPDFLPFEATITAGGFLQLRNSDGDYFHVGLNSGAAPA